MKIKALSGKVLVSHIQQGERMIGRIILLNDDGKDSGIRPRWCKVHAIGPDIDDVEVGDWILVKHGNWTRKITLDDGSDEGLDVWSINWPEGVLVKYEGDEEPEDNIFAVDTINAEQKNW